MRLSHIYNHIELQFALADLVARSYDNFIKEGLTNVSLQRVNARISTIKEDWERFSLEHKAITIALNELKNEDKIELYSHSYFTNNLFAATHEHYVESIEKLNSLIGHDHVSIPSTSSQSLTVTPSSLPVCLHHARLPRINLPQFNGTPSDWMSFKDLFYSLVISNPTLSPVEKLQYLKTSLTGSAALLLKNTMLSADNFQKSWEALLSFYENKRLLVNAALQSLLSIKRIGKESAVELEKLYTQVMQIYRTLENLQRPVTHWDDFLVYITVQKLDSESIKAWEQHLGASKNLPTWSQFQDFLVCRLLSLQAYEKSRNGKTGSHIHQNAFKAHHGKPGEGNNTVRKQCPICEEKHSVVICLQYSNKTVQHRLELIKKHKLCYNCLGPHRSMQCKSTRRCQNCAAKHHTTIHQVYNMKTTNKSIPKESTESTTSNTTEKTIYHSSVKPINTTSNVLLATAWVKIITTGGVAFKARILIDQGSEISLVTERLVQRLRLPRKQSQIPLLGIGAQTSARTKGTTSITLTSHFDSKFRCTLLAHILPRLTTSIPSTPTGPCSWKHLDGLQLADPSFTKPGPIDVILGADVYGQLIEEGIIKGPLNSPMAQRTKLSWIISGPINTTTTTKNTQGFHISVNDDIYDLLRKFWTLEETPSRKNTCLSLEEQECEDLFKTTYSRDNTGRYQVKLPFKHSALLLGDSHAKAIRIIERLFQQFKAQSVYARYYLEFIDEYKRLQHMHLVQDEQSSPPSVYYLPHHGVWREQSLTTKLRVVFNGSSTTTSGYSLNDLLYTGAKLQTELFDVLIWFRKFYYVFSTDVEKMFRQIKVHPDHWAFQRILWMDPIKGLLTYELSTVPYGLACAPYLSLRVFEQLIEDEGSKYPLAVPILKKGRYVDDIFGGADSIEQAQESIYQLVQLCMAGGFELQKWTTNHSMVLQSIPTEKQISPALINLDDNLIVHTLGLNWQPNTDTFQFSTKITTTGVITKRKILSSIAKLFDPLGFLSPVIVSAKILIQELWSIKLNWDDPLPEPIKSKWIDFVNNLQDLSMINIPRWIGYSSRSLIELHGFCDASQQAMAAVAYLRTTDEKGKVITSFLASKTKIAPLKRLTVPRLELSGAYLLTKLITQLSNILELKNVPIYMWTDSSITYTWLTNHPSRWKDFVHNRVCYIQETLPQATWMFVPGHENPADLATRGLSPSQLSEKVQWWNGPSWLSQPSSEWASNCSLPPQQEFLEERPAKVTVTNNAPKPWDLISQYSSLTKLLRITAQCQRAIARFKGTSKFPLPSITTKELEDARLFCVKSIQQSYFFHEIDTLSKGRSLPTSNSLLRLTPFLDSDGFLRLRGRLQHSLLPPSAKHPLILPRESPLTSLIIADAHLRTFHGGTQLTLSYLRTDYWIIGGRNPVRTFILKCVRCARYRQKRAKQLMGQLPTERVTPNRPFTHSGIDYAGPFVIKTWKGKNAKSYKAYIALFVCFSTSAVHLELVTDYTAEAFIAAFKRFTARRGICSTLTSDCGTNLRGADSELRRLFTSSIQESQKLATLLANDGTQWKFNPPYAPHFGGKWEAGVKSVKYHLQRVVGNTYLTYEEFTTLLTQIEAILNSRPLSALTEDPDDLHALTPGHFLMGCTPAVLPEPSTEYVNISRLTRWQLVRQMLESFWAKWSKECLQRYHAIYKWNKTIPSLTIGTLVLVVDERYPPSKWPLGRIIQTHPGHDGLIRVVTIRTQTSTLKRSIHRVCPLPVEQDTL